MVKRAKPLILCDTNVFLEYLYEYRGSKEENLTFELDKVGFDRLAVSVVTLAEVYRYTKKREVRNTKNLINKFAVISLTKHISDVYQVLVYYKNYHPDVADCLIAATAIAHNAHLFTFNRKHFTTIVIGRRLPFRLLSVRKLLSLRLPPDRLQVVYPSYQPATFNLADLINFAYLRSLH